MLCIKSHLALIPLLLAPLNPLYRALLQGKAGRMDPNIAEESHPNSDGSLFRGSQEMGILAAQAARSGREPWQTADGSLGSPGRFPVKAR